jgi:predicted lipid-binding transport protein (Tim44 family)
MKKLLSVLAVVLGLGMAMSAPDAEAARRMGAGKSMGTQRQVSPDKPAAAPTQNAAANAPTAAAKPNRSWMGPLAGIAAGLGLAALASHFGLGDELASIMMFALLAMVAMAAVAYFMRKRMAKTTPLGAGAGTGAHPFQSRNTMQQPPAYKVERAPVGGSIIGSGLGASASSIPTDFDTAAFERSAKVNFIRLQAANDAGNLDDIRAFTTPQMFAELKMDLSERGTETQQYEVNQIEAKVLDVETQADSHVVSVRFTGTMHDNISKTTDGFDEVWHLSKPRLGDGGWLLCGIQQVA